MTGEVRVSGFFRDECGNLSMGRILLVASLVLTFLLIYADSGISWVDVPAPAYTLLGTIFFGLLAWVTGPRISQHLGSAISNKLTKVLEEREG